ncbi:MAG: hypothetical protein DRQ49_15140 [Gammaproteobacteria bacterium]|nr:MAG: hypothetical protein DRQ49_15140 [Gammaproteobacteria bacterium]RKZ75968.1 MAG: hypothetical protein DRQ57_05615 [Gammaproteobacteria bacterium]
MKKLSLLLAVLNLFFAFSVLAESVNKKEVKFSVPPVNEETHEKTSVPVEPVIEKTSPSQSINEGVIAITTTPREADIYVNGKLFGNSTPIVLKLPEGKHQITIKKVGKKSENLDILITNGAVVSKKVILVDLPQPTPLSTHLSDMLEPKRDAFETEEEFQQRRLKLIDKFNQAVLQQNADYQAGIAYLDKESYNIENQTFPVRVEWQASWAKAYELPNQGYITAKRDDAKKLWEGGSQKSLYLYVEWGKNQLRPYKSVLVGLGKEWLINFNQHLPIIEQLNWQGDKKAISLAAFSPNLKTLASVTGKVIKLRQVSTGKIRHILKGHKYGVSSVAFSPDGKILASGSLDNTIKLWKVKTGTLISTLGDGIFFSEGHKKAVNSVAFTKDGKQLVSGGVDKTVKVWGINTGKVLQTLNGHKDEVTSIAITTYEDNILVIASGSQDKTIKLWFNTVPLYTLREHEGVIQSLAFSSDGKLLALGGDDQTIKLWRIPPCEPPRIFPVFEKNVVSLAFSPDGNVLASVSGSDINLWKVQNGDTLSTLQLEVLGKSVAFSLDGRTLASVDELNSIKVWGPAVELEAQE